MNLTITNMQDFTKFELSELVDLLAEYASTFSNFSYASENNQEYLDCRDTLDAIVAEIERRKKASVQSTVTGTSI